MEQNMTFGLILGRYGILEKNWAVKYATVYSSKSVTVFLNQIILLGFVLFSGVKFATNCVF